MNLKRNLKRILADRDMTASQLGRQAKVPKSTISEWLNGGKPRDLVKVKMVADALGLTLDSLCFGDASPLVQPIEQHLQDMQAGTFDVILRRVRTPT